MFGKLDWMFRINESLYLLNITNVTIRWHNLLRMQRYIQNIDGKWCRLLLSNENMVLKLTWQEVLKWLPWVLACVNQFQKRSIL